MIAQAPHLEAIRKARNCELHSLCDRAPDLLRTVAAVHPPARTFTDYDEMLADPGLDAVVVAVADELHVEAAIRALDAGKHVLQGGPLAVTAEDCVRVRDKAAASGRVLQVGTMRRFDEGIAFARDFIGTELGAVIGVKAWYCDSSYRYAMT